MGFKLTFDKMAIGAIFWSPFKLRKLVKVGPNTYRDLNNKIKRVMLVNKDFQFTLTTK